MKGGRARTLCETGLSTCGLAEDAGARSAEDDGLCVREDGGDGEAACMAMLVSSP